MSSERAARAGEQLAGGCNALFNGWCGDWKEKKLVHKYHRNYNCNFLCEKCLAHKVHNWLNAFNFGPDAGWWSTILSHAQYLLTHTPNQRSPYCRFRSWTIFRNRDDLVHMLYLGFGKDIAGQILYDMALMLVSLGVAPSFDEGLMYLWGQCILWARQHGYHMMLKVFTASTISWSKQADYPTLQETMKAKTAEVVLRFCLEYAVDVVERGVDTSTYSKTRGSMAALMLGFLHTIDHGGILLSHSEGEQAMSYGIHFLRVYQALAMQAHALLESRWKLRPKLHQFAHLCSEIPRTLENPARQNLYWAEDAVGKAKKVALKCHRRLVPLRVLQRRTMWLSGHWKEHHTEW